MRSQTYIVLIAIAMISTVLFPAVISQGSWADSLQATRGDLLRNMDLKDAAYASFLGERGNSRSGTSVAGLGDVNGDGFDDIIIGASDDSEHGMLVGQAYIVLGTPFGLKKGLSLSEADASFYGSNEGMTGNSVACAGDVNNDGLNDILIGSFHDPDGALQAGKVYLIFGSTTGWEMDMDPSKADASFMGTMPNMQCGFDVAGAGDFNNDGYDDILIGSGLGWAYLFFGKASGWSQNRQLTTADITFAEDFPADGIGFSVAGAGDVNGDGFDDIILGAKFNDERWTDCGQTYIFFGRSGTWPPEVMVGTADASFIGEGPSDRAGHSVAAAGDVNGDGYDDVLIGVPENDTVGIDSGRTYLILGKSSGWSMDTPLSGADASFIGETEYDSSGHVLSSAGDIDQDGLDDILISAQYNEDNGYDSGKVYLINGRTTGWTRNVSLSDANASFMGEKGGNNAGSSISGAGDVDGDGLNEILIGAMHNGDVDSNSGKTYLVKGPSGTEPLSVTSVRTYSDPMFSEPASRSDKGDQVYIKMLGTDGNTAHVDLVRVDIIFSRSFPTPVSIYLRETNANTGTYQGSIKVPSFAEYFETMTFSSAKDPTRFARILVDYPYRPTSVTTIGVYSSPTSSTPQDKLDFGQTAYFRCTGVDANPSKIDKAFVNLSSDKDPLYKPLIILTETGASSGTYTATFTVPRTMQYFENITLTSVETPQKTARFMVHTPVQLRAAAPYLDAVEDAEYRVAFYNFGYNPVTWTVTKNAYWLNWNDKKYEVYGTPRNHDVSDLEWEVLITIEDDYEHSSSIEYTLRVINTPPGILTPPVTEWFENDPYMVDFNCDDDGQGQMTWSLTTDSPFLKIDKWSGIVSGTPIEGDAGLYYVIVEVHDGHGGIDQLRYNLTVTNENDPPQITTSDIIQVEQDTPFRRDYDVYDPDEGDTHFWTLRTDAEWLDIENGTGVLFGTPDGYDIGDWLVNITVTDQGGLSGYREFTLKVIDIEDTPKFLDVPIDTEIPHGAEFYFDVNATDADWDDKVTYSAVTETPSNLVIDPTTGDLRWKASYRSMPATEKGMKVTLKASDGKSSSTYEFYIKVIPTQSPYCELVSPTKGKRTPEAGTVLQWGGSDPEDDPLTYILYLADTEAYVTAKRQENIVSDSITATSYEMTGLAPGKVYYWTIVPDDTCTYGSSTNGVFNFRVNNRPDIEPVKDQFIDEGDQLLYKIAGSDGDQDDRLTYKLESGPSGMSVRESTGMLVWTPKSGQAGTHNVKVNVTDGFETTVVQFRVVVAEGEGINIGVIIGIVIGILAVLVVGILLYFLVIRKKGKDEEGAKVEDEDEETRQLREELEQKEREKAFLESGQAPPEKVPSPAIVPSSASEAHAQDKTLKKMGYEELYGQPAPEKEEDLSAEELKDELEKLTEQLKASNLEEQ